MIEYYGGNNEGKKMSYSMYVQVLVVFSVLCFNPFIHCVVSIPSEPDSSNIHPDINILFISMVNDMPRGSDRLFFAGNFEDNLLELEPGVPYQKITNFDSKRAKLIKGTQSQYCVDIDVYNPAAEGDQNKIFWSMRKDAIYHSWDNKNWQKRYGWGSCVF